MKIPVRHPHKRSGLDRCRWKGRDYYFGPAGSAESDRRYAAWVQELLAGNPEPPTRGEVLEVAALVQRFLVAAKKRYQPGEFCNLKAAATALLAVHRRTRVNAFGPKALLEVRAEMIRLGWPRTRINEQVTRVRRIFRWGVQQEYVHVHTALSLRELLPIREGEIPGLRESMPVKPANVAQIELLLPELVPTHATMVIVQSLTGMRPGDLFIMRPGDIDRTDDIWIYRPQSYKQKWRGKKLSYALGPKAQAALKPFMKRKPDEFLFSPAAAVLERRAMRSANRKTKVQPSQAKRASRPKVEKFNDKFNRTTYLRAIMRAAERVAKGDATKYKELLFRPNQLRHMKATAVRAEHGIEAARIALGHSNITATLIYAEADLEKAKAIARASG